MSQTGKPDSSAVLTVECFEFGVDGPEVVTRGNHSILEEHNYSKLRPTAGKSGEQTGRQQLEIPLRKHYCFNGSAVNHSEI